MQFHTQNKATLEDRTSGAIPHTVCINVDTLQAEHEHPYTPTCSHTRRCKYTHRQAPTPTHVRTYVGICASTRARTHTHTHTHRKSANFRLEDVPCVGVYTEPLRSRGRTHTHTLRTHTLTHTHAHRHTLHMHKHNYTCTREALSTEYRYKTLSCTANLRRHRIPVWLGTPSLSTYTNHGTD